MTPGATYNFADDNGRPVEVVIVADAQTGQVQNADGTISVTVNGEATHMTPGILQEMADRANMQHTAQGNAGE